MTLRARLILTTLAVALPLTAGLFFIAQNARHADMDSRLEAAVAGEPCLPALPGGRSAGPGRPGSGGRRGNVPVEVLPYDAALQVATPDGRGPDFPESLRMTLLETGRAAGTWTTPDGQGRQLAIRISRSDADCAYVLARIRPRPGEVRDQIIALASIVLTVFIAVGVAAAPTITHITRLAASVRDSAANHYATPVPAGGGDEVASLATAFNDAGREVRAHITRVEARETALREFVANTTHDVAVPLTVLQTHLASLEQHALSDAASADVRAGMREAHYMGSLLRNLSAASRLDAGLPAALIDVDLNQLIERVVARHHPLARAAAVELNVAVPTTPITVTADPTLLEQAIGNLVDNAIRYNHTGGHVAVVLDRTPASHAAFVLTVSDDGAGVPAGDLPKLAQRRFRGDQARTRRQDGHGLGLAIATEVFHSLGWSLSFVVNEPTGLRVEIRG